MYYFIDNQGNYLELPYSKTRENAEMFMHLKYSDEEIKAAEMEVIDDTDEE